MYCMILLVITFIYIYSNYLSQIQPVPVQEMFNLLKCWCPQSIQEKHPPYKINLWSNGLLVSSMLAFSHPCPRGALYYLLAQVVDFPAPKQWFQEKHAAQSQWRLNQKVVKDCKIIIIIWVNGHNSPIFKIVFDACIEFQIRWTTIATIDLAINIIFAFLARKSFHGYVHNFNTQRLLHSFREHTLWSKHFAKCVPKHPCHLGRKTPSIGKDSSRCDSSCAHIIFWIVIICLLHCHMGTCWVYGQSVLCVEETCCSNMVIVQ